MGGSRSVKTHAFTMGSTELLAADILYHSKYEKSLRENFNSTKFSFKQAQLTTKIFMKYCRNNPLIEVL